MAIKRTENQAPKASFACFSNQRDWKGTRRPPFPPQTPANSPKMFRALRARGGSGEGGDRWRRRARRGAFGLVLLAVGVVVMRAVFGGGQSADGHSADGHPDAAYATRVYRGMFPVSTGLDINMVTPQGADEAIRANAFSEAYRERSGGGGSMIPVGAYRRPVILVIGDSLVQRGFEPGGWVSQLAMEYARSADVVLRGYSGYNTRWVKELMENEPGLFPSSEHVLVVVVLLGANDSVRPEGRKTAYGVDVPEYEENVKWILDRYKSSKVKILCTPPPIDQEERLRITTDARGMPADLLDRSTERLVMYVEAAKRVAKSTTSGVSTADLYNAFKQSGRGWEKKLLSDGLHFTEHGQALAYEILSEVIKNAMAKNKIKPSYDSPTHDLLIGSNNTDDWHGHLVNDHGSVVVVE